MAAASFILCWQIVLMALFALFWLKVNTVSEFGLLVWCESALLCGGGKDAGFLAIWTSIDYVRFIIVVWQHLNMI